MEDTSPAKIYRSILEEAQNVLVGNEQVVEYLTIALLSRGHVLLEGVPGIAKTTIANLVANLAGLDYRRVQLMPDLLPSDITGSYVYRESTGEFELRKGPIFSNVVVADEINRATPKTQSAFLQAMEEGSVSIEENTISLPDPFIVIATQNPLEVEGTYELPIAQRDRFQFKLTVDLPEEEEEQVLADRFNENPTLSPEDVSQAVRPEEIRTARDVVDGVYLDQKIRDYVVRIVRATRSHESIDNGASPRATKSFITGGKAKAAIDGRHYVIPEDIKEMASAVIRHRIILSTDAELSNQSVDNVIRDILDSVDPPGTDIEAEVAAANGSGENSSEEDPIENREYTPED